MKFVVVSNKTIERALNESSMLDNMKSDKERELEKKKEEDLKKKKEEEEKKKKENDSVIVKPPEDEKTTTPPPKDEKTTPPPKDEKTTTPPKDEKTTTPPPEKSKYVQVDQKMLDDKLKKDKAEAKAKADAKAAADAKAKDKLLSTHIPVVSKTKLGSTVRPVKPGSARDKMIARNEVIHGSDKIVKKREMNADFQRMKKGEITKTDFMKQYPNSQTAKKYKLDMISKGKKFENYEPYHIVLGYLLSEGHADTINEAHYVMTQMDEQTIKEIVALDEGLGGKIASVAAGTLGLMGLDAIRKQLQNKEKMDKGGKFRPGSTMDNIQKRNQMLKDM